VFLQNSNTSYCVSNVVTTNKNSNIYHIIKPAESALTGIVQVS